MRIFFRLINKPEVYLILLMIYNKSNFPSFIVILNNNCDFTTHIIFFVLRICIKYLGYTDSNNHKILDS